MTTASRTASRVKAQIENFNTDLLDNNAEKDIKKAQDKINKILKMAGATRFNFSKFRSLHDPMQYKADEVESILFNDVIGKVQSIGFLDDLLTDKQYETLESLTGTWARMTWSEDRKAWKSLASKAYIGIK